MIEREIELVAQVFARELTGLRTRTGRANSFQSESLELNVRASAEGVGFELSYRLGDWGEKIKAGELGTLLAEVARRQGWEDFQAGEMQEAGRALSGGTPAKAVEWLEAQEAEGDPGAEREEDYGARRDDE